MRTTVGLAGTPRAVRATGVLIAAAMLAACGSGGSDDSSGGDGGSGETTLSLWQYYGSPDMPTGKPLYDLIDRYEQQNPDVTIDTRYIPFGDFTRTLLQSAAGGDLPDIALINAFHTRSMAEAGVIQDISDRVEQWGEQDAYFSTSWQTTQVDGATYGVPHLADAYAVYYNETMLAEAGIEPPTTWAQMKDAAATLAKGDRYGLAFSGIEGDEGATALIIRMLAAGGDPADVDSAAGRAALSDFADLVDSGAVSNGVLTWNEEDVKNQFANGQAAMMINSATYVSILKNEHPDLKWNVALLPKDEQAATFLSAENLAIGASTDQPDAAWDVITWMQRPDVLAEYLPERNKLPARNDVDTGDDPVRAVFAEQLQEAWAPEGDLAAVSSEVFTHIQGALQASLGGGTSVEDALAEAQSSIDESMSQAE
ncbi:carbohydrate ABC transporter substrate-binding protein (CUT1 family) [Haloactinopolyspora alba]|uniref:Carbohydrate ABC transporter substrate-binding protein (CUT1 family) n=1 Tax=Haloactinopolyspora alba TaxID=648780 RepID=A0A2P8DYW2_9ACTN|nr:sugar ABC transporter substrate-binding protein [Haloactinopolyspora alba]PSL02401.1 carbohydrate ABC transporter substrate-binding protein (CUT1 family) [Haloactinopolyspora alba]